MNDFVSMEEAKEFRVLGPMPEKMSPLDHMDQYQQGVAQVDIDGVDAAGYCKLMERFQKTFRPGARAPAGGEVLYELPGT